MDKYDVKNYIYIFLFIVLPVLTGYIASRRGRSPVIWGLFTLFSFGISTIIIFILPKRIGIHDNRMNDITRQQIQVEIDRAQMQTMEQLNHINQMNDMSGTNNRF